jgi:hypothetical protein
MSGDDADENPEQHPAEKWYDHKASGLTKAVAAIVVYGLFIFIDVHDIWPWSSIVAIVVGILVTIALLYLEAFATGAIGFFALLAASAAIVIAGLAIYAIVPLTRHPDVEVTGTILPADDPNLPNACDRQGVSTAGKITIFLGSNVATRPNAGKSAILVRQGTPLVTVEKTADGLYIDAMIFDATGKLVGTVTKNRFTVLTGDNSYIERRGDLSTLGIFDKSGTELLYVRFLNTNAMRIRGVFYSAGMPIARITDSDIQLGVIRGTNTCFGSGKVLGFG